MSKTVSELLAEAYGVVLEKCGGDEEAAVAEFRERVVAGAGKAETMDDLIMEVEEGLEPNGGLEIVYARRDGEVIYCTVRRRKGRLGK